MRALGCLLVAIGFVPVLVTQYRAGLTKPRWPNLAMAAGLASSLAVAIWVAAAWWVAVV